ncbi:type II secretion system F family protein [Eubacterium sp.]|uniref:type II secretion system F family protein n=1 Tax=Eubacterium sp. TaxID=142586 RepID=UPI0025E9DF12|nr:type II secretion system F family protein [Eubacterium sp.]MCR5629255.1 type II secretion system F family protein [Eubacterium sp.]
MINALVFAYTALAFMIVVLVLWDKGTEEDTKDRRIKVINRRNSKDNVYNELDDTFVNRFIKPLLNKAKQSVEDATEKSNAKSGKNEEKEVSISKQLRLAGVKMTPGDYAFIKQAIFIVSMVLGVFIAIIVPTEPMYKLLLFGIVFALGYAGPDFVLKSKVNAHQEAVRQQLPDAMDLLGTCIEAGLSFDGALVKVAEKMEGPFIDELIILYNQIQMGKPRNDALKQMGDSSEIQELKTFVAALAQANELGIPINNVMQVQSEQLRETRKRIAQEKGLKAPVKMMIPMVGLIFPNILIVIMAPSVLNMMGGM